jgi:hypothetical protein
MAQIADKCPGVIQFCRTRVTLLDDDGTPHSGTGNYYVSDKHVSIAVTSDVEEGQRRTVRSGCDCVVVTNRGADALLGYTFELVDGVWEPAMQALMLGYQALEDTSDDPVVIGYNVSGDQLVCGGTQARVALEAWAYAWDGAGQDADLGLIHYVWPLTKWQVAPYTLSVDPTTPTLTGFSLRNDNWTSPYADAPLDGTYAVNVDFFAAYMEDLDNLPDASCGLQTVVIA